MNRRHWQQNQQERKEKMRLRQKAMKEAIHLEISGMQQIEDEQLQEIIDRHVLAAADREHLPLRPPYFEK